MAQFMGDSDLILSQRLGEWCGHAPVLEEDLALTNTALDLLGQARLWLGLAGELEGRGRGEDELAFLRDAGEYRNLLLAEQPNGDYAQTMVRQYYFDAWHRLELARLRAMPEGRIAEIAAKAATENAYHLRRSRDWVVRMGDGTDESHRRAQAAAAALWPYTGEMFAGDSAGLREVWMEEVRRTFAEATLEVPTATWAHKGGREGVHTEALGHMLAEMQFLQRAYPHAKW
ncbi:MAG TPA: 1,2-phenylacetyl-CoA epoxidase subunit PaaC [Terriglobales bacterium]|nr:1,2-phenylacetyl-CoA epoxidase subunit PaaC [Terriglobales bacterium]